MALTDEEAWLAVVSSIGTLVASGFYSALTFLYFFMLFLLGCLKHKSIREKELLSATFITYKNRSNAFISIYGEQILH